LLPSGYYKRSLSAALKTHTEIICLLSSSLPSSWAKDSYTP